MHTHTPQGEKFPKNSHPGGAAAGGGRKIFFGHIQCVHTPLVPKPVPTYVSKTNKMDFFYKFRMKMWVVAAFNFLPLPNTDCEKV